MSTTKQAESKQNDTKNTSSALLLKLKHILDNVTTQETVLQNKTSKIEKWYHMHKSALQTASTVKKQLMQFEPINEKTDNPQIKQTKTENKNAINMALDNLTNALKFLHKSEIQYRSTECNDELTAKTQSINQLQNKNNILVRHNKSLLESNSIYEEKIKLLTEQHNISIETTKKDLFDRHKDYVENLQHQHKGQLKSQKIQYQNQLTYELAKLKKDKALELEKQLNELSLQKNIEFERERYQFQQQIDTLKHKYNALETDMNENKELLTKYVELDKEHQQLTMKWCNHKKKLTTQILELKENQMKSAETLLQQVNENNKLQSNAVKHALIVIKHSEEIDKLNLQLMELKTASDINDLKMLRTSEKYELLLHQYKIIKQEKCALIKEVKKLRENIVEKDFKKSEILSKMSANEMVHAEEVNALNGEILVLRAQHSNVLNRFEELIKLLSDCNSHIENFGDTINNFSVTGLRESYDCEYDARIKSTQLLNDTLENNITAEIIKLHGEINFHKIKDELREIVSEKNERKLKTLFDESEIQINYIRIAMLKLLMEYIESVKGCNDMYVKYNKRSCNEKEEEFEDGMYNYVTSGVSAVATLVNPFSWNTNQNDMDAINIDQIKDIKKQRINVRSVEDDVEESENKNDNDRESDINDGNNDELDEISTHYLAKSEFLSVSDTINNNNNDIDDDNDDEDEDVIEVRNNNSNQINPIIRIVNDNVTI